MEPRPLPSFTGFCIECHLAYPFLLGFTGFSTGFHVGYRVLLGFSLEPALAWIGKSNVTGFFFYWVSLSWVSRGLPSFTGFSTRFHGGYRVLLGFSLEPEHWFGSRNPTLPGFFLLGFSWKKKHQKKTSPRVPAFFFKVNWKKKQLPRFLFFSSSRQKKVRA